MNRKNKIFLVFLIIILAFVYFYTGYIEFRENYGGGTDERANFAEYDALFGWINKKDISGTDGNIYVHQNNYGLKMHDDIKLFKDKKRVAFIGDSFIWGYGVGTGDTVTYYMEQLSDYEVLNFGVSGYGTGQYYLLLKNEVINFDPDIIIVGASFNDFENAGNNAQYGYSKPMYKLENGELILTNVPVDKSLTTVNDTIFIEFVKNNKILKRFRNAYLNSLGYNSEIPALNMIKKEYTSEYEYYHGLNKALYCRISEFASNYSIPLYVVNIPSEESLNLKKHKNSIDINLYDPRKPSEIYKEFAQECDFELIDLYEELESFEHKELVYDGHWTIDGNKYVALFISRSIGIISEYIDIEIMDTG